MSTMNSVKFKCLNEPKKHLTIFQTCLSGVLMGSIAYSGSFSVVPILYTITALIFGASSHITITSTAFGQLLAGYLHTHASRTGMLVSTHLFGGFYVAKSEMKNRRQFKETRWESLKRYFFRSPSNSLVLNFMWETFTIFYIIQTELIMIYYRRNFTNQYFDYKYILLHGLSRCLAGCMSGMSTGLINQLWQRYQASQSIPYAIFNTDKDKLKLQWKDTKKLLSPFNLENWIKVCMMISGALFVLISNLPNRTGLHLLDLHTKKLINDFLVIHGGWLFLRDAAMLVFKKHEKSPVIPLNTIQIPLMTEENHKMNKDDPVNTSNHVDSNQI